MNAASAQCAAEVAASCACLFFKRSNDSILPKAATSSLLRLTTRQHFLASRDFVLRSISDFDGALRWTKALSIATEHPYQRGAEQGLAREVAPGRQRAHPGIGVAIAGQRDIPVVRPRFGKQCAARQDGI